MQKAFKNFIVCSFESLSSIVFALPRHKLFNPVKANFLKLLGSRIGKGITFYPGIKISPGNNLVLGDHVDLAWGVLITTKGGVEIGARTLVGYNSQIFSANHIVPPRPNQIYSSGHSCEKVLIGKDVWIGAGCIILPGVEIGEGAVVAAGSVVTKSIPEFSYAAGVPAKVIKIRE